MVTALHGDLYTPFPHSQIIEEGFQSSEEGSDLHSPIFEVPYPQDARYHLGHLSVPDVTTSPYPPPPFNARYDLSVQIPDSHLLETLQDPNSVAVRQHLLPQPSHSDYGLQQQAVLNLGQTGRSMLSSLSPSEDFAFNLPQSSLSGPQLSLSQEPFPSASSRAKLTIPSPELNQQQPTSAKSKAASTTSGGSATSSRQPRREASTTVIACRQCRARKIRCDSTRPVCNNCTRRNNECEYDAVPKRRGPDKRPGTRQRSCKKRPLDDEAAGPQAKKKRKMSGDHEGSLISFDVKENVTGDTKRSLPIRLNPDDTTGLQLAQRAHLDFETRQLAPDAIYPKEDHWPSIRRCPVYIDSLGPTLNKSFTRPIDVNMNRHGEHERQDVIPLSPTFLYTRQTWWDDLLNTYAPTPEQSMNDILADLSALLNSSSYWLFFINPAVFFDDIQDDHRRSQMQPSLVLSALALATLMKSSEIEHSTAGRTRALYLRDMAQATLEEACTAQSVDFTLAEAALILALFESSSHPKYSSERAKNALEFMDRIIMTLSLTFTDTHDPDVSRYAPHGVPMVHIPQPLNKTCQCLDPSTNLELQSGFSFTFNPPWGTDWTLEEIRREECRRICWSALTLVSSHTSQCAAFHEEPLQLQLAEPSNYALLFPGEVHERSVPNQIPGQSPKDSIWALYCRSMLLWNSCMRQRDDSWSTEERANFAVNAWQEIQAVQEALDYHTCNLETALIYVCREYLYNTRMTITYELRRLSDLDSVIGSVFNRRQAQEWLHYQDQIATRVKASVLQLGQAPSGHLLSKRPFQTTWFASQVAICLALWNYDQRLINALDLAKSFLIPLDALNALWPSPVQRHRRDELRVQVEHACRAANVTPPLDPHLTLPPLLQESFRLPPPATPSP
ncbi:hypothetical protein QCA50_003771 [Cerrena zonata]|uniref:Zn(2)-C6 fungal-type domain-containing protein n=1 Tax=Cerrena zonata TaxID=2478898 RepID=A0AAW0GHH8_9APHY